MRNKALQRSFGQVAEWDIAVAFGMQGGQPTAGPGEKEVVFGT